MRSPTALLREISAGVLLTGILLAQSPAKSAIFSGGPGDGYAAGASGSSDLRGNVGRSHKFTGGQGDGFSAKAIIFTPPASVPTWQNYGAEQRRR